MRSRTIRLPDRLRFSSRRRASALILTLIFAGVLAISVGSMLFSVRHLARSTSDKVAFEEAYVVGQSGLAAAKAWLINPDLAVSQLGAAAGLKLAAVTSGALALSHYVRDHREESALLASMDSGQILSFFTPFDSGLGGGGSLDGDRVVLVEFTSPDDRLIKFRNGQSRSSLFDPEDSTARSCVRRLRITTPFRGSGTSAAGPFTADDLRRVSLILEAEAVALSAGSPKTRVLQQKVLLIPGIENTKAPGLAPGAAVTAAGGAGISVGGNSSLSVHWGPGWSTNNIELLDLTLDTDDPIKVLTATGKFFGAGIDTEKEGSDKWLKWQTSGLLTDSRGNPILRDAASTSLTHPTINGVPVTDFFVQILNGDFGPDWSPDKVQLDGDYLWKGAGEWASPFTGEGVLYDPRPEGESAWPLGSGALVQKDPSVAARIDSLIRNDLDYTAWKTYAIANNGYVRPTGSGKDAHFVNNDGQVLYVTPDRTLTTNPEGNARLTNLDQLSMADLIPDSRNTSSIPDRILFIDTVSGTEDGPLGRVVLGSGFFWKGLLFCMADVEASGVKASQSILMKNPDEYAQDPKGDSTGTIQKSCLMDGVLYVAGNYTCTGNGNIYGSLICRGGFTGSGTPDIWFNTRNRFGLFREPVAGVNLHELAELVSCPITENAEYL